MSVNRCESRSGPDSHIPRQGGFIRPRHIMLTHPLPHRTARHRTTTVLLTLLVSTATPTFTSPAAAATVAAAELKSETEQAWRAYIRDMESRRARDIATRSMTGAGAAPTSAARPGPVTVTPLGENGTDGSVEIAGSSLIHHWRGRVVIPGVTLEDVLRQVRRAPRQSDVLASKILEDRGDTLRVYLKLTRKELITVTYNTEHLVELTRHGPGRASSRSVATKIAELADVGTPQEREKPAGSDLGLLWRLNAYWWYEEVPGGVLVECESLSLSRGIPLLLKPFASGTVDRVARESMTRTLATFREQVAATSASDRARVNGSAWRTPDHPSS
jgi:hypothetical protein